MSEDKDYEIIEVSNVASGTLSSGDSLLSDVLSVDSPAHVSAIHLAGGAGFVELVDSDTSGSANKSRYFEIPSSGNVHIDGERIKEIADDGSLDLKVPSGASDISSDVYVYIKVKQVR